jgi:hypothetical protein
LPLISDIDSFTSSITLNPTAHTLEQALSELETLNMKYLNYNRNVLIDCLYEIFDRLGFITKFNINRDKLRNFLRAVAK